MGVGLGWFQRGFASEETKKKKKNANVETDSAKKKQKKLVTLF